MGGPSSGYPIWKPKRPTTESALALDVRQLSRNHSRFEEESRFVHTWHHPGTRDHHASIGVRISRSDTGAPTVALAYRTDEGRAANGVTALVALDKTYPFFGGVRYWFVCPSCGRRSAILYLTCDREEFLCRRCHGLTYQSCQDSHRFDKLFVAIAGNQGNEARKALAKRFARTPSQTS